MWLTGDNKTWRKDLGSYQDIIQTKEERGERRERVEEAER